MLKQLTERLSLAVSVVCRYYSSSILVSDISINIFNFIKIMNQKIIVIELCENLDL